MTNSAKKYYDNPYQTEYWNSLKEKQYSNDTYLYVKLIKLLSIFLSLFIVYLILR